MDFIFKDEFEFPETKTTSYLKEWHMKISDAILDNYVELQRSTIFSDTLYSAVNTVLFKKLILLTPEELNNLCSYEIICDALKLLELEELKELARISHFRVYKPELLRSFKARLKWYGIEIDQLEYEIQLVYPKFTKKLLTPWILIGFKPPKDVLNLIKVWVGTYKSYPINENVKEKWSLINVKNF